MTAVQHPPRPRRQQELAARLVAFAGGISRNPAKYRRTKSEAAEIRKAVDAFVKTLKVASRPVTKTRPTVREKDNKRETAERVHSKYYNLIKADPQITDSDKVAIGVLPVNPERTPISVPVTVPLINAIGASPHKHTLRFTNGGTMKAHEDGRSGERARKPHGAMFIQLYVAIGRVAGGETDSGNGGEGGAGGISERLLPRSEAREVGLFTKNPIHVEHKTENNGKQAVYWARWISPTGDPGGWSQPTSMAIVA